MGFCKILKTICCSCNIFPKFNNFGTLLLLRWVWFSSLIWFNDSSKRLFIVPEMIHFCFAFGCIFKCLNRNILCSRSCHCGEIISFSLDICLRRICLNRLIFHFKSERFVTSFSAVADDRLRSLPIIALTFQTPHGCFRRSLSLGFPPLRLQKTLAFWSF